MGFTLLAPKSGPKNGPENGSTVCVKMPMSEMGAANLRWAWSFAIRAQQWSDPGDSIDNSFKVFSRSIRWGCASEDFVLHDCVFPDMLETHIQCAEHVQQSRCAMKMMSCAG